MNDQNIGPSQEATEWLRVAAAAEKYGVPTKTLYNRIRNGAVRSKTEDGVKLVAVGTAVMIVDRSRSRQTARQQVDGYCRAKAQARIRLTCPRTRALLC